MSDIAPERLARTCSSPTGSGPEGSSPNETFTGRCQPLAFPFLLDLRPQRLEPRPGERGQLHRFGRIEIGRVERRPDPADNRVKRVYVCDAAAPVFMLMAEEGQRVFKTWMSGVAPAAEAEMLAGLRRIRANAEPR